MSESESTNKTEPFRYVSLAEHQALQEQFSALVKHVESIRFNGSSIELPESLQALIAE